MLFFFVNQRNIPRMHKTCTIMFIEGFKFKWKYQRNEKGQASLNMAAILLRLSQFSLRSPG